MSNPIEPDQRLMTPAEVAAFFRVDAKTVTRWALAGRLPSIRTLGGHRRYREVDVLAAMRAATHSRNGDAEESWTAAAKAQIAADLDAICDRAQARTAREETTR